MKRQKKSFLDCSDYFCGAGGTGQGAKAAGLEVVMAANHWRLATETYETNFTEAKVYCADITASDPRYFPSTTFGLFSPECTTHSPAGGNHYASFKKQMDLFEKGTIDPAAERSRMTMWDVVRFTEYHDYEIVVVENVVEAKTRWPLFDNWLQSMHTLGYSHECLYINSMHCHPTPQSRDRMYVVFWKKGNPKPNLNFTPEAHCSHCDKVVNAFQWWKNPSKKWGKYGPNGQYLFRCPECTNIVEPFYHAAFNIIDWTIPGKSVIDRKIPLSKNTIRRIEYGLEKYGDTALVIGSRYKAGMECRVKPTTEALATQPTQASHSFVFPYFIKTDNSNGKDAVAVRSALNSFRTLTTSDPHGVVLPFAVELTRTGKARSTAQPISTVLAGGNHHGVVQAPILIENNGQSNARPSSKPLACVTTEMKHGVINPEAMQSFLSYYNGGSDMASYITEPAGTVSTRDRIALVQCKKPTIEDCTYRTIRPHEVHKAMAFRDDYVVLGNGKQQVKQLGNAVTPPVQEWILNRCKATLL